MKNNLIISYEFRVYNPDDFVSDAHTYRNSSPPNLIQTSSKLWLGAVYSVKILFLKLHIKITSHNALKLFCVFAINSSRIARKSRMINKWELAEDMHRYTYGDKFFTLTTFDTNMQKILEFIQTFQEIDVMDVRRDLKKFLMNSIGFRFNRLNYYIDARIGGETYSYNIVCASGPKSELVTRLFDSLMAEEKLLEEGPGGESIDLSGVNMDEVLGLDDEKDTHSSITANEDIEEGKEKQPASCDNSDESMKNNDEEKGENKTDDRKEEEIKGKLITREDQTKRKGTTDEDVKMLKLAERVGLPVKRRVSESESDDILTKREKRFGSFSGNKEGEKILTKKDEEEAKEKRAARFGLTDEKRKTTDEDSKMLKRAERFGLPLKRGGAPSESEQSEVLAKREKRFGKVIGSGDTETKKEARIKRFGVVS
uniref:Uncharacterized protein n=1 Tax=Meloidogyne javanica TaxID=6303 RepID=A0A915MKN5_MELJA